MEDPDSIVKFKTTICSRWSYYGVCPYGSQCHFAHGTKDLRMAVASPDSNSTVHKSIVCKYWEGGTCKFNDKCRYSHSLTHLQQFASPKQQQKQQLGSKNPLLQNSIPIAANIQPIVPKPIPLVTNSFPPFMPPLPSFKLPPPSGPYQMPPPHLITNTPPPQLIKSLSDVKPPTSQSTPFTNSDSTATSRSVSISHF